MQIPVLLDRAGRDPLTNQIVDQLRQAIRAARIPHGARLPSSRRLSEQLEVARNTVVRAYETLMMEGLVESRPASGVFVSVEATREPPGPPAAKAGALERRSSWTMPIPATPLRAPRPVGHAHLRISFDFCPGRPNRALFPMKTWRRLMLGALSHGGGAGFADEGDPAGLPALRSAIAAHLAAARGIVADPSRIIIINGVQEGISLASRLFLSRGTLAALEDPGFQGAAFAFEAAGSEVVGVAVDRDGLVPEDLPMRATALLYVTPSHQFPTGHVLHAARREAIAAWARRCGCYILEDDSDGEFRYEGSPLPAIAATAPDCTIYLGSFARTLGAGLRLGFLVAPAPLAEALAAAKALLNNGNAWLDQAVLAEMMHSNGYAMHLTRIRAHYKENRDGLIAALRRNFGDVRVSGEGGGLHLVWYLPPGVPDAAIVESLARRARIGVYSLGLGGAVAMRPSLIHRRSILLGFGALVPKQIDQGIDRLSDVIDDAVDDLKADVNELLVNPPLALSAPFRPSARTPAHLDSRFRRPLALPKRRRARTPSARNAGRDAGAPMATVSSIYRYPVKGLSAEPLSRAPVEADRPLAFDRIFALARPGAPIDRKDPKWAKKGLFAMLMLDEGLACVATQLNVETMRLVVRRDGHLVATGCLKDDSDREALEAFFWSLLPGFPAAPVFVQSRDGHFMDKPDNVISLINLATVRSLESQWGAAIDPLRFRANIYIDGLRPWEEFDWVGQTIAIGGAVFSVDRKNGRCGATNVNPATGRRDLDIPGSLRAAFGHKNLGVYLIARESGEIAVGDAIATSGASAPRPAPLVAPPAPSPAARRFICRGCYLIYDEAAGLPHQGVAPGTSFDALPADWRCADCGAEKSVFRPYVDPAAAPAG